jgi:hypothetical protein
VPNDLPLVLATGASKTFANLAGKKATVFVFVGTECPISNKYAPTIFALEKAYRSKGVRFATRVRECAHHGRAGKRARQGLQVFRPAARARHAPNFGGSRWRDANAPGGRGRRRSPRLLRGPH